jgi:RNA polymerase sigma-70 factor, ECF subfamily
VPSDERLAERLDGVLRVVYLVYTEGHVTTAGEPPVRGDLCDEAIRLGRPGPYVVQAAIAALHSQAPAREATDWPQIAALYDELARRDPSPVVALNRAVVLSFAESPEAALAILDELAGDPRLERYQPLHAARADLLRRSGDAAGADAADAAAIALSGNAAERAALERRRRAG